MRLIDCFDRGYTQNPDGVCLIEGASELSFRQVWRASHRIANRLRSLDLGDEAVVAVLSTNHLFTMVAVLGILRSGYVWMPLNSRNAGNEIEYVLRTHDARFIFHHSAFAEELAPIIGSLPSVRGTAVIDAAPTEHASLARWMEEGGQA